MHLSSPSGAVHRLPADRIDISLLVGSGHHMMESIWAPGASFGGGHLRLQMAPARSCHLPAGVPGRIWCKTQAPPASRLCAAADPPLSPARQLTQTVPSLPRQSVQENSDCVGNLQSGAAAVG